MPVISTPFESQHGFKGPGFSVDGSGNIVANSIVTAGVVDSDAVDFVDFTVIDTNNDFFITEAGATANPAITLARQKTYSFNLDVPDLGFQILLSNTLASEQYSTGLSHSSGATVADAQNKSTGTLRWSIPNNAPDILYYADTIRNNFGIINVVDPEGLFSTINSTSTTNSTSSITGAITVAGGVGIAEDLYVGGRLNVSGTGIAKLDSTTNLDINAANKIILQVGNIKLGEINSQGLAIAINNSSIDNTVIGATSPSTAAFTSGTVSSLPTVKTSLTNRQYVDSTSLSLAIAFGL